MSPDGLSFELQALLDAAVDAVVIIDQPGAIQAFNRAAERLFGYAAHEVLGHNVSLLMPPAEGSKHDGYLQRFQRTSVPHIIGVGREVAARRKDGLVFPAFLSVGAIARSNPGRYVGFIQDLTLRQQTMAAVVHERDRANSYLEVVQTVLVGLDSKRRVTLINRAGCELFRCDEAALLGQDWFERAVLPEDAAAAAVQFEQFLQQSPSQPLHCEYRIRTDDHSVRLLRWRYARASTDSGSGGRVLCSGDDVTDARQAEAEARRARERMMHVSRLATMGEMTTGISHELNQPLAAIATYAQAARRLLALPQPEMQDARDALDQIAGQAMRAGEIIRRLRNLARNRHKQRVSTQLNDLITEMGGIAMADARVHDVQLRLELAPTLPLLELDPVQIQQVVLNLVRNAIQSMEGSKACVRQIIVSTRQLPGAVELQVADTGAGVASAVREQLFMPFATTRPDGTGLGLAISRSIIEAHGGTLDHAANAPVGSRFYFRLPEVPVHEHPDCDRVCS